MFDTYLPDAAKRRVFRWLGSRLMKTTINFGTVCWQFISGKANGNGEVNEAKPEDQREMRLILGASVRLRPVPSPLLYVRAKVSIFDKGYVTKPLRGWEQLGDALNDVEEIDADHLGMLEKPAVSTQLGSGLVFCFANYPAYP
ncbi:MAG: hypothetical protein ACI82Z_001716 [Cellvibrionaceae bacterium]|jgi:hypothetical protein